MSTLKVDTYLTRGGASEIAIDKLKGVTAAGSMLVVGEGGTVTTNLQQGLAKAWVNFKGPDTFGIIDSFNLSSMDDNGVGDYTMSILNDMASVNYSITATGYKPSADFGFLTNNNSAFFTAATARVETVEHDGGHKQTEFTINCVTFHGDLA
jgi:hypothetical protein